MVDLAVLAIVGGVILVLLIVYGPSKIPKIAHAIGRSFGEFKKGRQEVERELKDIELAASSAAAPAATPAGPR